MKPIPVILSMVAAAAAATAAWMFLREEKVAEALPPPDPAPLHEVTMAMQSDQAEIFRRALWRRPDATDKILHAERREWTVNRNDGVARWQWFIEVEPGPALTKWLREDNAFGVRPAKSAAITAAPAWFPADLSNYEIHTGGTSGSLVFLYSRDGKTLCATGSGKGFTPGAPEPDSSPPVTSAPRTTGRLPATPPPNPK